MPGQLRLGFTGADGRPILVRQSDVDHIETILWEHSVLCYQVDLPARLRKGIISNAPKRADNIRYFLLDRNLVSEIANLFQPPPQDVLTRKIAVAIVVF